MGHAAHLDLDSSYGVSPGGQLYALSGHDDLVVELLCALLLRVGSKGPKGLPLLPERCPPDYAL